MLDAIEGRWEYGSEFHLITPAEHQKIRHAWSREGRSFGSGRDALRNLLLFGQQKRGWKRIWVPSYYCYEVIESIITTDIEVLFYYDSMIEEHPNVPLKNIASSDVILIVNFFGLRSKSALPSLDGIEIIEDHTHDPWSKWAESSQAEFCFASLRKTLPISDGGVLWSPLNLPIPPQPIVTVEHQAAAAAKLSSMLLKSLYLRGFPVEKTTFRTQAITGEKRIASGKISGITETSKKMIDCFPCLSWRKKRLNNFLFLENEIKNIPWCRILKPKNEINCPFSIVLLLTSEKCRDDLQQALIKKNIYPAVLWPLRKKIGHFRIPEEHIQLSENILSIHCDMRYGKPDIKRVAKIIINYNN